jgi:hypothetical protein
MHEIEPFYNWRHIYVAEEDELSPFYGREYSEFQFTNTVYNYYIHPQWDEFGSRTLYLKIILVDYELHYAIIEMIGEWNDTIENDIMSLKREVIDKLRAKGISKFILIAENVLNFHSGDKEYYIEWQEEIHEEEGWAVILNMTDSAQYEFKGRKLDKYISLLTIESWRTYKPYHLFRKVELELAHLIE